MSEGGLGLHDDEDPDVHQIGGATDSDGDAAAARGASSSGGIGPPYARPQPTSAQNKEAIKNFYAKKDPNQRAKEAAARAQAPRAAPRGRREEPEEDHETRLARDDAWQGYDDEVLPNTRSFEQRRRDEEREREALARNRKPGDKDEDEDGKKKPELPKHLQADLLRELNPKLREELCRVLRAQENPNAERPPISPQLSRILARYQRRAEMAATRGFGEDSNESWPLYLGLVLFAIIVGMFVYLWLEDKYTSWEAGQAVKRTLSEDAFWREHGEF